MEKRVIDRNEYSMVVDWSNYQRTTTKLLCACQRCGEHIYNTIHNIDHHSGHCYCKKCQLLVGKETKLKLYGDEYYTNTEKMMQTNLERRGVRIPTQDKKCIEKGKLTKKLRYGDENYVNVDKIKETKKLRYGDENYNNMNKVRETNLEKRGFPSPIPPKIIDRNEYKMVVDWSNYKSVHSDIPCKCDKCGSIFMTQLKEIVRRKTGTFCENCSPHKRTIDKDAYPMVKVWDNYVNTHSKLLCTCQRCGSEVFKTIKSIDKSNGVCNCDKCKVIYKKENYKNKTGFETPFHNPDIQVSVQNTFLEKYHLKNPMQDPKIREKVIKTNQERYGKNYHQQKNREDWQIKITSTKEDLEAYLKDYSLTYGNKPTFKELEEQLGFTLGGKAINEIVHNFELMDYIDLNISSSNGEKELQIYVSSLGFITGKKLFKWGEIDVFVPEKNIGFEFNGCYWHNDQHRSSDYHYNKVTNAEKEGIRLIHIWEHEWLHNQEAIKSYIKAQLGLCEHRVYARKCKVREITYKEALPLLQYHQQGKSFANVYIGLYNNNELVLTMLFAKSTKSIFTQNPIAEWEIKREICKEGYSVVGGKSKVFKYFVEKYNPKSVVSYVDRSKFTGKSYQIMGFKLDHINPARYDWVYKENLIFKKRQPKIYKKMRQLYNQGEVYRIYDSGRYCYVWRKE